MTEANVPYYDLMAEKDRLNKLEGFDIDIVTKRSYAWIFILVAVLIVILLIALVVVKVVL